jgi:phage repressor protein C with HTH and peptisase S24 domain
MMTHRQPTKHALVDQIDKAIRERIRETDEFDRLGNPVAAIPASDKLGLAKKTGAEIEHVEQRLNVICEEVVGEERFEAVPRYRLRGEAAAPQDGRRPDSEAIS